MLVGWGEVIEGAVHSVQNLLHVVLELELNVMGIELSCWEVLWKRWEIGTCLCVWVAFCHPLPGPGTSLEGGRVGARWGA